MKLRTQLRVQRVAGVIMMFVLGGAVLAFDSLRESTGVFFGGDAEVAARVVFGAMLICLFAFIGAGYILFDASIKLHGMTLRDATMVAGQPGARQGQSYSLDAD